MAWIRKESEGFFRESENNPNGFLKYYADQSKASSITVVCMLAHIFLLFKPYFVNAIAGKLELGAVVVSKVHQPYPDTNYTHIDIFTLFS